MSGEETLNHLFDKARKAPLETNVNDIQKWIGLATIGTILFGLLSKLNVVFTKTMIMYSAAFLTVSIGLTTYIAFNYNSEQEVTKPVVIVEAEQVKPTPLPVELVEEEITAISPTPQTSVWERESLMEQEREESPFEVPQTVSFIPFSWESQPDKSVVVHTKSEEKDYGSFNKIKLRDAVDVYILQGSKESVRIEGEPDPNNLIEVKNVGGTLTIGNIKSKGNIVNKNTKQKVFVTLVDISRIDCSGAINLESKGQLNLKKMELVLSGATDVELDLTLDDLILNLSGATDVKLSGQAASVSLNCSGASTFDASNLKVNDAKVECSGANYTKLYITGNLELDASGASDVKCKGNPTISKKTLTGAARYSPL